MFDGIKAQSTRPTTFAEGCSIQHRAAAELAGDRLRLDRGLRRGGRRRQRGRPGRARARRVARDERRGRVAHGDRPAGPPGGADRGDQGDRQAVRRRAVQRPPADARRTSSARRRRSSRRGSRASRPATRSPTSCSARSTRAASCRCRSRSGSARCRSTTTTSRPAARATPTQKYNSRYRDLPTCAPLYEFGYGLSYTQVRDLEPAAQLVDGVARTGSVTRLGRRDEHRPRPQGDEVVQLYIHDPVASISQPVRRLRGFERVTLEPGEKRTVDVHARPQRLRLLRQPRQVRRRAGPDRRVRGQQLERGAHAVVHW